MISYLKKWMPDFIKDILRPIKQITYDAWQYNQLLRNIPKKHTQLIKALQGKQTLRVAFLVSEKSKWKVDEVFRLMQQDTLFSPFIIVTPFHKWDLNNQMTRVADITHFFQSKGYEVYSHFSDSQSVTDELEKADLIFFSEPYDVARNKAYYSNLFSKKLCFYIPYFFMATTHVKGSSLKFNGIYYPFLLSMWKIYWPHNEIMSELKKFDKRAIKSSVVTGYPSVEYIYKEALKPIRASSVWKDNAQDKIKIIYAPHHTILNNMAGLEKISTFIENSEVIKELAIKYQKNIAWSFKPHPTLLANLYVHPAWGKEKADAYYQFWQEQEYTQFDNGAYDDLFLQSDAIIHDCSSFIVEYAFTQKPCLYLIGDTDINNFLNDFGKGVIGVYQKAHSPEQIEGFIKSLINNDKKTAQNTQFFNQYLEQYYQYQLPSERIIHDLKQSLGYRNDI